ncbi:MAG: HAD family hydrolase [Cetobacterium sp.]|uniref:HAD family hydrolase n=1 Tax=Cetobacterium sp. TaxID=2071632 RepID=UPI002FC68B62
MIKLIVTDMDGTLLNDEKEINNEFWEIFEKLKDKNILFAIASGRQYYNLLKNFESIRNDLLFIAENGTYVVKDNIELFCNSMNQESIVELVELGRKLPTSNIVLCGKNSAYIECNEDSFINEVKKYYERYEIVDDILKVKDEVLKVTFCDLTGTELNVYPHFQKYETIYKVAISGEIWLDITNLDADKGEAILQIQNLLNITYDETMVFGDYLNDLEMMSTAKYSFAMENAHPKLKEVSNFIAKNNNENGVIETIKDKIFNKKD